MKNSWTQVNFYCSRWNVWTRQTTFVDWVSLYVWQSGYGAYAFVWGVQFWIEKLLWNILTECACNGMEVLWWNLSSYIRITIVFGSTEQRNRDAEEKTLSCIAKGMEISGLTIADSKNKIKMIGVMNKKEHSLIYKQKYSSIVFV